MKKLLVASTLSASLLLAACGNDKDSNESVEPATEETVEPTDLDEGSASMLQIDEPVTMTNGFGETTELTIKSVEVLDSVKNYESDYPDGKFIKIIYNAKNVGKEETDAMGIGDTIIMSEDGTEYTSAFSGFEVTDENDTTFEIKPNLEKEVYTLHNVPSDFEIDGSTLTIQSGVVGEEQIEMYELKETK